MTRLLATVLLTLLGASFVSFGFIHLAPIEPARFMIGFRPGVREEQINRLREWYGLDDPIPVQYVRWMGRVLRGDFGSSLLTRREIGPEVARRVPWSVVLVVVSALLAWGLAVPLAVVAARRSAAGWLVDAFATAGLVIPTFLVATMLVYFFAVRLTWIPILPPFELNLLDRALWLGLLLPGVSLALPLTAVLARQISLDLRTVLPAPYIATARAKGVSERRVVWRHALRVATRTLLAQPLPLVSVLFSAMLVVEEIYNWPGVGRIFMRAITMRDLPVVQAVLLVLAAVVIAGECLIRLTAGRFGTDDAAAGSVADRGLENSRPKALTAPRLGTRVAVVLAAALVVAAIAAPLLVRFPPDQVLLEEIHNPPSFRHWMGTDSSGRDLFSRLVYAGRASLGIALGAAVMAVLAGILLTLDLRWSQAHAAVRWAGRVITSLPALALALTLIGVVGRAPFTITAIFATMGLAAAVTRLRALQVAASRWSFVEGARAAGASAMRIGERHLLPHLARPLVATAAGLVPGFLLLEATLGFLGFSVTPTIPTWGTLLWRGREALHRGDWWLLAFPTGFLAAASWAFLGISEALGEPHAPTHVKSTRLALGREWGRATTLPQERTAQGRGRPALDRPSGPRAVPVSQSGSASSPAGGGSNGGTSV